jgi:hypothetical protein
MKLLSLFRTLLTYMFRRSRIDSEMEEEFRSHLQSRAAELERRGLSRAEAERQARIEFGGYQRYKEECCEALGTRLLGELTADLRYGLRVLRKNPGLTTVAVLTLALGIGANTAVFTLINALMLRSLPVDHPEQLVFFGADKGSGSYSGAGPTGSVDVFSYQFYQQFRERDTSAFKGLTALASPGVEAYVADLHSGEPPRRFEASLVDGNFFHVLGVNAIAGRTLIPDDDRPGDPRAVTVLSYHYWAQNLGRNPNVIGKTLEIDHMPFMVVGVAPPDFFGVKLTTHPPDLWFPLGTQPLLMHRPSWLEANDEYWLDVFGRLNPGVSPRQTAAALRTQLQQMITALEGYHVSTERSRHIHQSYIELVPGAASHVDLRPG